MKWLFLFSFALCISNLYPQTNLVPNYSFEQYSNCPNNQGQIYFALPWFQPNIINGNTTNSSSTEYYNQCSSSSSYSVPNNSSGYQLARTGVAYAGIDSYFPSVSNWREYIEIQLSDSLVQNRKYCAEFYVSLYNLGKHAIDAMCIYFSNDSVMDSSANYKYLTNIPQVCNIPGNFLSDTGSWMLVSGIYVAEGGERFITIGNFNDDATTDTIYLGWGLYGSAYYYIDDVSLYEIDENFPANLAGSDKTICKDSAVTIGSPAINGFKYLWSPAAGLSSDTVAQPTANPAQTTTYILQITNDSVPYSCKPTTTDTVTVTVKPKPVFTITATGDSVCTGDSVILSANNNFSYQWSTGDTTSSLTVYPLTDTIFFATATDNGCSYADSVLINATLTPTAGIIATDTVICSGEKTTLIASGGTNYLWSTEDTTTSITIEPANNTIYHLTAFNENCNDEDSVSITVLPLPDSANILSETITIFIGEDTMLTAIVSTSATIWWSPSDFLSCITCSNPLAIPVENIMYYMTVTSSNGCAVKDSVMITVKERENKLFLPGIFSPNADGYNDIFRVRGENIAEGYLAIYNRWGEKVFDTQFTKDGLNDVTKWWDGTKKTGSGSSSMQFNAAVFVYFLKVTFEDGKKEELKGNVTLVR